MGDNPVALAVAIIGAITMALGGFAAYRRSGPDRDSVIVGSAETVVGMLTSQVAAMDIRLSALEGTVSAWEGWATRCMDVLDKAISLLDVQHKAELFEEASAIKADRPRRTVFISPLGLPQPPKVGK